MNLFDQMMSRYEIQTNNDYTNALHEVMQQVTLAGLHRGGFFDKAAFYGGTCLRIFHGVQRFSEDMDFSLLQSDESFMLENYFESIINEFKALGRNVVINRKIKKNESNVESAFLKDDTAIYNLQFTTEHAIKIKIEVDINPPLGFSTESKLLLLPYSFMTRCYTLPNLYAGKMHALLFRNWKNRVKGRDWYDFEWYVRNNVTLDFKHLCERTDQFGSLKEGELTQDNFKSLLNEKIAHTNIEMVKADVKPFIKNPQEMDIWSADYFMQLVNMIRFE
ncbi:Nucleotidyl transferase AbiEii toxin, Type IV TA system [Bacteroides luti]|uniref:Nucleotidyl transferase AbiEii toxin, Type IV TA system n=1 Tax=Bacteroides luti TaxID=1297750 RepID=A0A1M4UU73_9BACE|nr:nucleotidyl transferase AbiEii/AbiGii toxin family protein [Bacteroides luti]SHE60197.1 Nucleotidyl transferase AbiEii toxin, Type IV TA system [Bacteroides luti]